MARGYPEGIGSNTSCRRFAAGVVGDHTRSSAETSQWMNEASTPNEAHPEGEHREPPCVLWLAGRPYPLPLQARMGKNPAGQNIDTCVRYSDCQVRRGTTLLTPCSHPGPRAASPGKLREESRDQPHPRCFRLVVRRAGEWELPLTFDEAGTLHSVLPACERPQYLFRACPDPDF